MGTSAAPPMVDNISIARTIKAVGCRFTTAGREERRRAACRCLPNKDALDWFRRNPQRLTLFPIKWADDLYIFLFRWCCYCFDSVVSCKFLFSAYGYQRDFVLGFHDTWMWFDCGSYTRKGELYFCTTTAINLSTLSWKVFTDDGLMRVKRVRRDPEHGQDLCAHQQPSKAEELRLTTWSHLYKYRRYRSTGREVPVVQYTVLQCR